MEPTTRPCTVCGAPVLETKESGVVHQGGGAVEQRCISPACGWKGSGADRFINCPSCSDATQLIDDHRAS